MQNSVFRNHNDETSLNDRSGRSHDLVAGLMSSSVPSCYFHRKAGRAPTANGDTLQDIDSSRNARRSTWNNSRWRIGPAHRTEIQFPGSGHEDPGNEASHRIASYRYVGITLCTCSLGRRAARAPRCNRANDIQMIVAWCRWHPVRTLTPTIVAKKIRNRENAYR